MMANKTLPSEIWLRIGQLLAPAEKDEGLVFRRKFRCLQRLSRVCRHTDDALHPLCRGFKEARVKQVVQRCIDSVESGDPWHHAYYYTLRNHGQTFLRYDGPLGKFIGIQQNLVRFLHKSANGRDSMHRDFMSVLVTAKDYHLNEIKQGVEHIQMLPLSPSSFEKITRHILDGKLSLNTPKAFDWLSVAFEQLPQEDLTVWKACIEQECLWGGHANSLTCRQCAWENGLL